jgi:hypothetical protein
MSARPRVDCAESDLWVRHHIDLPLSGADVGLGIA